MKKLVSLLLILVLVVSLVGCGGEKAPVDTSGTSSVETTLRKNEILRVGFPAAVASFTWSPLLIAQQMGYFDEEGIDIVFEQSYSSSATRMVAANQVEFSVPGPHLTAAGIESDMEIISVFQWFPVDIFGFAIMADSDMQTVADLGGKKIGTMTPTTKNQVIPIIEAAGVDADSVEMIPVADARLQQLSEGKVDAVWTWDGEWQQWKAEGQDVRYLSGEEFYKSASNSIIANTKFAEEYPELVERFSRALAKGSYFCYKNPRAAGDIIITNWPSLMVDLDTAEEIVKTATNFMIGGKDVMGGNTIGFHNESSWDLLMEDYVKMGIVSKAIPLEKCFTNKFIEAANDWDRTTVDNDAVNYEYKSK